ncbi:MAG: aminopeptidase P N-terminal domain-containing protein [Gemmatimonadota bacterium]
MTRGFRNGRLLWILAALAGPSAAAGQQPAAGARAHEPPDAPPHRPTPEQRYLDWAAPRFPPEEYHARRQAMMDRLWDSGGGAFLALSADGLSEGGTFRQTDDFLYFTGLELPGSALILDSDAREARLFLPDRDPRFESAARPNDFPRRPLGEDTALVRLSGINETWPIGSLASHLARLERDGRTLRVDLGRRGPVDTVAVSPMPRLSRLDQLRLYVQSADSTLRIRNAYREVARLRMVKSEPEIRILRRAARLTMDAITAAARSVREGVDERSLEGAFEAACKRGGAQRLAFASIIKSGPNSLWPWRILAAHYDRRNRVLRGGDLVIFDVGCELDHYASDMGRTFPVSGRFTDRQRELLEMEVAVSDAIIAAVRPGVTLRDLQEVAVAAIPPRQRPYMQAGLYFGHHIGLSVGDPSLPEVPLEPGMVFTVEPWYYNHDLGISVFTEDEVLVTRDGAELLTRGLPRRPAELERMVGARPH